MTGAMETLGSDHRRRLLLGMAEAVVEVGYADVSIAEIVRRARVSKRTFYEHFGNKEECLLALYEAQSAWLLSEIEAAIREVPPGEARVEAGAAAYLRGLRAGAGLVRTMLVEIFQVGPAGLALRRRVLRGFADLLLREFEAAGAQPPLTPPLATALVGGINELILDAVESDRVDRLEELSGAVAAFVRAFLGPPPSAPG